MRFGLTILTDLTWQQARPRWIAAEQLGFDSAWTYDHLTWGGLPESPWRAAMPTLTAAALVTDRIRLGTFVASPNFRHPVAFQREVQTLDEISGGRLDLGLGTGGDLDSRKLAGPELSVRQRVDRFAEFVGLLDRVLVEDHVDADGDYYGARDVRLASGCVQQPRVPFVIAANGPRSMRLARDHGQGWLTMGQGGNDPQQWWDSLTRLAQQADDLGLTGRRYLNLDGGPGFALESTDRFEDYVGRAAELGFTDVITHWPRPDAPYAGDEAVLERVASEVLPRWRD